MNQIAPLVVIGHVHGAGEDQARRNARHRQGGRRRVHSVQQQPSVGGTARDPVQDPQIHRGHDKVEGGTPAIVALLQHGLTQPFR
jgi:hypothetical protein